MNFACPKFKVNSVIYRLCRTGREFHIKFYAFLMSRSLNEMYILLSSGGRLRENARIVIFPFIIKCTQSTTVSVVMRYFYEW